MSAVNNATVTNFESWFIPVDITAIISLVLAILLAVIFLIIVVWNKTCRTIPMLLTCNSCIAEIIYGSNMLGIAVFTLKNDRKQNKSQDAFCVFRDYLGYVGTALLLYSFILQAVYRYIIVVYPGRISWQSLRVQSILMCFFWIFSITSLLPWFLAGASTYNVDNQGCLLPFQFSIPIIYNVSIVYVIPFSIIILIYIKLVRYVHLMSSRTVLSAQSIFQARRELAMVKRIVAIICVLVIFGLPFTIFMLISFVMPPPKYHYRFSLLCADLAQTFIMIGFFKSSKPVMNVLSKFKHEVSNGSASTSG